MVNKMKEVLISKKGMWTKLMALKKYLVEQEQLVLAEDVTLTAVWIGVPLDEEIPQSCLHGPGCTGCGGKDDWTFVDTSAQEEKISKGADAVGDFLNRMLEDLGVEVEMPGQSERQYSAVVDDVMTEEDIKTVTTALIDLESILTSNKPEPAMIDQHVYEIIPYIAVHDTVGEMRKTVDIINNECHSPAHNLVLIWMGPSFVNTECPESVELAVMKRGFPEPLHTIQFTVVDKQQLH